MILEALPELIKCATSLIKYKDQKDTKNLMKEMIALIEEQRVLFSNLEIEIQSLREGVLHSGLIYLEEANNQNLSWEDRNENIKEARKQFINFIGSLNAKPIKTSQDFYQIGFAQSYVGFCSLIVNKSSALDWFKKAILSLDESLTFSETEIDSSLKQLQKSWKEKSEFDNKISLFEANQKKLNPLFILTNPIVGVGNIYAYKLIKKVRINKISEESSIILEKYKKELSEKKQFRDIITNYKVNLENLR